MSERRRPTQRQHEPLRIPAGWNEEERRFVMQLEEILDNLFQKIGGAVRTLDVKDGELHIKLYDNKEVKYGKDSGGNE